MGRIKKDNKLMALLSVWGILLVLLGHSGFEEPIIQEKLHYLHGWIYSFHMPLFFMISGYLFSLTNRDFTEINANKFLQKKAVRLLVPYVVLGIVLYFAKYIFSELSHATRDFSVTTFFKMFISPGCDGSTMGYLWYVFTLFAIFVVVVVLNKLRVDMKNTAWCIVVMAIFWIMWTFLPNVKWLNWSSVCRDLPFFICGILLYKFEYHVYTIINTCKGGGSSLLVSIALSVWLQFVDFSMIGYCISYIIKALIGLVMSIQLCLLFLKSRWIKKCILPMSKYTYSIYLLSWFGHYAAKILLVNVLNAHYIVVVLGMFVTGWLFPLMVCQIVDKVSWLDKQKLLRLVIGY